MKRIGLFLLILLCVSACTAAQPEPTPTPPPPTAPPATPTPEPTETPEEPSPFWVTFDGAGCVSEAPETLPADKHSFLVVNSTDTELSLWITLLIGDVTYQDLLDQQSEPGEFFPAPYDVRTPVKLADKWDDSLGGKFYKFSFYEEGDYVIALGGLNMDALWFCAPLHIGAE